MFPMAPHGRPCDLLSKAGTRESLAFGHRGRLFVSVYLADQVDEQGCLCAGGQAGRGFKPTSLYVTTHSGSLLELPGALTPR